MSEGNVIERLDQSEQARPDYEVRLLEEAPEAIRRPLCLVRGRAYAATWLWAEVRIHRGPNLIGEVQVFDPPIVETRQTLAVIRDDGQVFSDGAIPGAEPLTDIGATIALPELPPANRLWSGAGVQRYLQGERPDPADVFERVVEVVDAFMDFSRSLTDQRTMSKLTACYVLATYFLDAFNVIGYLWPNGDRGSGKTRFLNVTSELAYLGQVILAGGSYATLRDLADCGATLAFDDSENIMDRKRSDPDKRSLLLAGNRRGAIVTVKEPAGKRGWVTRHINAYCPRLFSAIRLPDEVLGSRTIIIPLVRSVDEARVSADPVDHDTWPHNRRRLVDDLWATALTDLPKLRAYDAKAAALARLSGRDLDPWRAILAVALWLQEKHGVTGLFERIEELSVSYQKERIDLEATDPTRLAIMALGEMFALSVSELIEFTTADLTQRINRLAQETEVVNEGEDFTNSRRVGRLLGRLRLRSAPRGKTRRGWRITRAELDALARSYSMDLGNQLNGGNGGNGETAVPDAAISPLSPCSPLSSETRHADTGDEDLLAIPPEFDRRKPAKPDDGATGGKDEVCEWSR